MNLENVLHTIRSVEKGCGLSQHSVQLLAVSKKQSIKKIHQAYDLGQRAFGENYLQEAIEKIHYLKQLDIEWHFIGRIQSNKTKLIAENFSWVQTVCDEKVARRLSDQRLVELGPLNVCIQVNVDGDPDKAGVSLEELPKLCDVVSQFKHLRLRGLMTIPQLTDDEAQTKATFEKLKQVYDELQPTYGFDTLSMGMSGDLELAIAAGSTMVRVGAGVFGPRG